MNVVNIFAMIFIIKHVKIMIIFVIKVWLSPCFRIIALVWIFELFIIKPRMIILYF
jgi:hypothetical protein